MKKNTKGKRAARSDGLVVAPQASIPIPRPLPASAYLPPMVRARLVWSINGTLVNVGAVGANTYIQVNYPQIPQLSATTTPGGLTNMSEIYVNARVLGAKVVFEATNLESFPMTAWTCVVGETLDGGLVPTANDVNTAANLRRVSLNPSFKDGQMGPTAGGVSRTTVRGNMQLHKYLDTPWSGAVDDYTCSSTASSVNWTAPDQILYLGYGAYSTNASTVQVSGVAYRIHVEFDVIAFGLRNLTT